MRVGLGMGFRLRFYVIGFRENFGGSLSSEALSHLPSHDIARDSGKRRASAPSMLISSSALSNRGLSDSGMLSRTFTTEA